MPSILFYLECYFIKIETAKVIKSYEYILEKTNFAAQNIIKC